MAAMTLAPNPGPRLANLPGKLIVFEGGEGCGKSTQLAALKAWLLDHPLWQSAHEQGKISGVMATREPGGTALGQSLRRLLLESQGEAIQPRAELMLYAADRAQHVETVIRPALAQGYWVLCDRYIDSTVAYQGYGRGLDLALIARLNAMATGGLVGDLTLWLQLDAEVGLARTRRRGAADRIEQADLGFHRRVQQGFEAIAQEAPERVVAVPAAATVEVVAGDIQRVMEQRLGQWYGTDLPR